MVGEDPGLSDYADRQQPRFAKIARTPFGGNIGYDDPAGLQERSRRAVNDRIRHGGLFDAVVDFDAAVRDPAAPRQLNPAYDTGDHLHMNPAGYGARAEAVPLKLLH